MEKRNGRGAEEEMCAGGETGIGRVGVRMGWSEWEVSGSVCGFGVMDHVGGRQSGNNQTT